MIGSTLTALAANPAPDPGTSLICARLSICTLDAASVFWMPKHPYFGCRSIRILDAAFVPLRFAIIFYSKILIIESSPQQSEGRQFSD